MHPLDPAVQVMKTQPNEYLSLLAAWGYTLWFRWCCLHMPCSAGTHFIIKCLFHSAD